ncbi:hypothetical protein ACLB2K_030965 [Fragaria x ananassa]
MATAEKVEQELPPLPLEIIRQILAWLPVKSIGRFRCVKKSWNSLTRDPKFIKLHYDKATEHEDVLYQRRRVFLSDMWMLYFFNLDESLSRVNLDDNSRNRVVVDKTCVQDFMGLAIHSNGLLFMRSCYHEFSLFNTAINQTKNLPCPPTYDMWTDEVCGYGFDVSALDYTVVHGHFCGDELRFSVYSLKTGSWRVIGSSGGTIAVAIRAIALPRFFLISSWYIYIRIISLLEVLAIPKLGNYLTKLYSNSPQVHNHHSTSPFALKPHTVTDSSSRSPPPTFPHSPPLLRRRLHHNRRQCPYKISHTHCEILVPPLIGSLYPYKRRTQGMEGRVVNGGVHWLVGSVSSSMVIISFDLAEEDVREIPMQPGFNVVEGEEEYYLSVFEGCLCVGKKDDLVFWVMKE